MIAYQHHEKFDGTGHVGLTPGEFTQLTGRAGRRGIDVEGHAVVLWHATDEMADPAQVAGLASRRTYPLRSSFSPTYNMAVNLVGRVGPERARGLLEQSFAQYQTDKSVVDTTKSFTGSISVPQSVSNLSINITDKDGKTIKTIELGEQSAGKADFVWDGKNEAGEVVDPGTYTFAASSKIDGTATALTTYLPATVSSVTLSQTGGEMMLNLAGLGTIALSKVQTIGI